MTLDFTVIIPTIPSRYMTAQTLYDSILHQVRDMSVEVLMLTDNKQRSIGKKREMLVKLAQGDYIAFVDDDDEVSDYYVPKIVEAINLARTLSESNMPDVIVFPTKCSLPGFDTPAIVDHRLHYENEQPRPGEFRRRPWHVHPWRREFVVDYTFPDCSYGEDWGWVKQFVDEADGEAIIAETLYHYTFDPKVSEADNDQS